MAGTIRKRSWVTRQGETKTAWQADYYDQTGQRHRQTFANKRAADTWLNQTRLEVQAGIHMSDRKSITVAEAAALWLRRGQLDEIERGTLRTYEGYVRLHLNPLIGKLKLTRLQTPLVVEFRDKLLTRTTRHRARGVLFALKAILKEAQRRGLVTQNVALPVTVREKSRDQQPLRIGVDVPTKAEVQAMLSAADGRRRAWLAIAVFAGLRGSELRALLWSDIDFEGRTVSVCQRADWWGTLGSPKSRNGYREIPLTPMVLNTLKEWHLASPPRDPEVLDLVFPGRRHGAPLHHTSLQQGLDAVQLAAGVVDGDGAPKYRLHMLRHFFASWGIELGFSPKRLQELMGHGSIRMTYDTYGHLFPSAEDDQARFAAGEQAVLGLVT
jgi:integrase